MLEIYPGWSVAAECRSAKWTGSWRNMVHMSNYMEDVQFFVIVFFCTCSFSGIGCTL